jgi:hypothetical protein
LAPEELEQQRIAFALQQGMIAARLAIPGTAILAIAALPGTGMPGAIAWATLTLLVLLLRNALLRRAADQLQRPGGLRPARQALVGSTMTLAFALGLLPALAFSAMPQDLRLVMTVFYCCWVCAGMASLGMAPGLYTGYLAVVLGAVSLGWVRSGSPHAGYLAGVMVLYALVLRSFARNITRRI